MKTLIFFGAGSTAALGAPITSIQESFFRSLVDLEEDRPIRDRLKDFLRNINLSFDSKCALIEDIELTLRLLYDGDGKKSEEEASALRDKAFDSLIESICDTFSLDKREKASLEHFYRIYVFPYYDWLAFKSIAREVLEFNGATLQDLLTVLNKAYLEGISIPTPELFKDSKRRLETYVNYRPRIEGALRVYRLLIFKLFKYFIRVEEGVFKKYKEFTKGVVSHAIDWGQKEENSLKIVERIKLPVSLATLNWDPIFPFLFLREIRDINQIEEKRGRRFYLSYGAPFLVKNLNQEDGFIIDEDAAFYTELMTEEKRLCKLKTRILKFFVPHGLMNMRVCPNCQNVFLVFSDKVGRLKFRNFLDIFLLDPIPSNRDIQRLRARGFSFFNLKEYLPSQIDCPYCKTPTFFNDTFLQIQTIQKPEEPPAIKKSYFDYAKFFAKAQHLIFIGYSFPIDDIPHLLTLMTFSIEKNFRKKERKFSLILYNPKLCNNKWLRYSEAVDKLREKNDENDKRDLQTLKNVLKLADERNIRVNFCGFPNILNRIRLKDILVYS